MRAAMMALAAATAVACGSGDGSGGPGQPDTTDPCALMGAPNLTCCSASGEVPPQCKDGQFFCPQGYTEAPLGGCGDATSAPDGDEGDVEQPGEVLETDTAAGGCDDSAKAGLCCCEGDVMEALVCKDGAWTCDTPSHLFSGDQCSGMDCGGPCSLPCSMGCCSQKWGGCQPGETCAGSACKATADLTAGQCWADSDCATGQHCEGAKVCPCLADCTEADAPGTCQ